MSGGRLVVVGVVLAVVVLVVVGLLPRGWMAPRPEKTFPAVADRVKAGLPAALGVRPEEVEVAGSRVVHPAISMAPDGQIESVGGHEKDTRNHLGVIQIKIKGDKGFSGDWTAMYACRSPSSKWAYSGCRFDPAAPADKGGEPRRDRKPPEELENFLERCADTRRPASKATESSGAPTPAPPSAPSPRAENAPSAISAPVGSTPDPGPAPAADPKVTKNDADSRSESPMQRAESNPFRTWTDKSGRFKIEARFIQEALGTVTLEKGDGKRIEVPFDKLSAEDERYIRSHELQQKPDQK